MIASKDRGHAIEYVDGHWRYVDTGEKTAENPRPCGHCGEGRTPEGHDKCLGTLPGVMNACCGHGETRMAYVQFPEGKYMQGQEAIDYQKEAK